jgi:hypothetical protein
VYFYKLVGGVWTLQVQAASGLTGMISIVAGAYVAGDAYFANFGQRKWAAPPPAGALAICSRNLLLP